MNEQLLGFLSNVTLSMVVAVLVKVILLMIVLLALLVVRQVSMMNKVVSVPIANWFQFVAWGYFLFAIVLTAIVMVV